MGAMPFMGERRSDRTCAAAKDVTGRSCVRLVLMAILEKGPQVVDGEAAFEALAAVAPRMEPASRDKLSTKATKSLLDYCSLFGPPYGGDLSAQQPATFIVRSISSARLLAALLSHPGCVAEQREDLLHRFEELVLYGGKSVPWKPLVLDVKQPTENQLPRRRFHNLHDAAAWIQQNWPDFDLEASCPVTWPGETHDTRSAGSR